MENKCKRFLSLLLALVMVLGMFPMGHAHAEAVVDGNTITMEINDTHTISVAGNYADVTGDAIVDVEAVVDEGSYNLCNHTPSTEIEDGKYVLYNTRANKVLTNTPSGNRLAFVEGINANNPAMVWTITASGEGYTIQDSNDKYLAIPGDGKAELVENEPEHLITLDPSSNNQNNAVAGAWEIWYNGQALNDHNLTDAGGYGGQDDAGSQWKLYKVSTQKSRYTKGEAVTTVDGSKYYLTNHRSGTSMTCIPRGVTSNGTSGTGLTSRPNANTFDADNYWVINYEEGNGYTVQDCFGNYLTLGVNASGNAANGWAAMSAEKAYVDLTYVADGSNADNYWTITKTHGSTLYFMNDYNGGYASYAPGNQTYQSAGLGNVWYMYAVGEVDIEDTTEITFTALMAGTTEITIGDTIYTIIVKEEPRFTVEKLTGITGVASSEEDDDGGESKPASYAFDGNVNTFWATEPNASGIDGNEYLIANLNGKYLIDHVVYQSRPVANAVGTLKNYTIWVSTDGETYEPVASGTDVVDNGSTTITFEEPVLATHVKLTATESLHWNSDALNTVMSAAEFEIYKAVCLEHTPADAVEENRVEATLGNAGSYDSVVYCSVCCYEISRTPETIPALTAKNAQPVMDGWNSGIVSLSDCEYVLGGSQGAYSLCHGGNYYVKPAANGNSKPQQNEPFAGLTLEIVDGKLRISAGDAHLHVHLAGTAHTETGANPWWNKCDRYHADQGNGSHDFYLMKANPESTNANIPGYEVVTSLENAVGGSYLIAFVNKTNDWFVMFPGTANASLAKVVGDAVTHTHDFAEEITTPATCTTTGLKTLTCGCGHVHTEEIAANGHSYESVVTEPTCTEKGYTTYTCACGDSYIADEVDALGHNYESVVTEPTCTEKGYTTYTCACGDSYTADEVAALGHNWQNGVCLNDCGMECEHEYDEGTVTVEPDCVNNGEKTYTCTICGGTKTEEIAANGHTAETVPGKAATCTEPGLTDGTKCSVCETVIIPQEEIPAAHGTIVHVDKKWPTCTAAGNEEYWYCINCQKVWLDQDLTEETTLEDVVLPAVGHYYEVLGVSPATCTEEGYTVYECWDCGNTIVGSYVAALGHKPAAPVQENFKDSDLNNEGSYDEVVYCSVCEIVLDRKTYTIPVKDGAAASVNGYKYATFEEALAAAKAGEFKVITLLAPVTVTEDTTYDLSGVKVISDGDAFVVTGGTLILNGNGYVEGGHSGVGSWTAVWANGGKVIINGGTYTVGGDTNTPGTHQNDVIYTKAGGTVEIYGGLFLNDGTVWTLNQNDETGGKITVYGGTFQGWNPANNVSEGKNTNFVAEGYCAADDGEGNFTVQKHSYKGVVTEPTCTEKGYTTYTCYYCRDSYVADEVDATGHSGTVNITPATCTEKGCAKGVCDICGETFFYEEFPAKGHTEGEVVVENNVAPTCTEAGSYDNVVYCTVCDAELNRETVTVDALGHSYQINEEGKMACACGELVHGIYEDRLYNEGVMYKAYQLVNFNGNFYFINDYDKIAKSISLYLSEKYVEGHTFDGSKAIPAGIYEFDKNGVMQIPESLEQNGVVGDYFYTNGVKQLRYQLIEFEGNFYFINDYDKVAKNITLFLSEKFVEGHTFSDGTAIPAGLYEFDENGVMQVPDKLNGVEGDYFYINGVKQRSYQLIEFEGSYYFINDYDKVAKNITLFLSEKFVEGHTFSDGTAIPAGLYKFDENGVMQIPEVKNGVYDDYLYIDGVRQNAYQLIEFEGHIYFVYDCHKIAKNCTLYLTSKFAGMVNLSVGYYDFDANGWLVLDAE